jgi:hypothetical protein
MVVQFGKIFTLFEMTGPSLQRIVFAVFHHLNENWSLRPLEFTHKS